MAGFVARQEDQHYKSHCHNMQGAHWRKYGQYCYGLNGLAGLSEGEKVHNRKTAAKLLNSMAFLHRVDSKVSISADNHCAPMILPCHPGSYC